MVIKSITVDAEIYSFSLNRSFRTHNIVIRILGAIHFSVEYDKLS